MSAEPKRKTENDTPFIVFHFRVAIKSYYFTQFRNTLEKEKADRLYKFPFIQDIIPFLVDRLTMTIKHSYEYGTARRKKVCKLASRRQLILRPFKSCWVFQTEDEHPHNANGNIESATINQLEPLVSEENSKDRPTEQRSGEKLVEDSSQFEESAGPSAGNIKPLGPALDQEFTNGLLSQSNNAETSLEGNNCATGVGVNASGQHGLPIIAQDEAGAPVHSYSDSSVQTPCVGRNFTFYALVQDHPAIQEQWFSIHFVPTDRFREGKVSRQIKTMEEQQGIKIIPMGDEYLSQCESQHFHTAFLDAHLKIKFELVNQVERKFIIRDAQVADKSPLQHILSLGEHRFPGAIAKVCVKCIAQPGEPPCEDHLRVTIEYGNRTTRHMLISFWSSG